MSGPPTARAPRRRPRKIAPSPDARAVALDVIIRVTDQGGFSNLALPGALRRSKLSPQDRGLVTELVYGTLRRLRALDRALDQHATRPVKRMSSHARALLRLGAYQLLFLRIPAHAAVSETVALAGTRERGFVNAVLRRLALEPPPPLEGDDDGSISIRTSLSPWAVADLRRLVGDETPVAAAALAERAPLCVRVNPCRTDIEGAERALRSAGFDVRRGSVHPGCLLFEGVGDPTELPGFADGWYAIQDQASAFVVAVLDPQPGDRVLDVCAGPGGKAVDLACRVGPSGVVVAADVNVRRAGLVDKAGRRLGARPLVLAQDALRPALEGTFDRVLVDAPCSGIGSARRRPELLWRMEKDELSALARSQVAIVDASARLLRPGGRLVYSVCTFPRAETDAVVDAVHRHRPDLAPTPTPGPDGPAERHRLWPHRHGCDAMFVAAFETGA